MFDMFDFNLAFQVSRDSLAAPVLTKRIPNPWKVSVEMEVGTLRATNRVVTFHFLAACT
jgi:hypothetical protein